MIAKIFDNGWGTNYRLKQFESTVISQLLCSIDQDPSRSVLINSVWYTEQYHHTVLAWLRQNQFDHIILIAMIDAAIPCQDMYAEFSCPVSAVGYYPGQYHLDFWTLVLDRFFEPIADEILLQPDYLDTAFMCLNRKPHWHRRRLYHDMETKGVLNKGLVTMGSDSGQAVRSLEIDSTHDDLAPNAESCYYGLPNDLVSLGHINNWQRCLLNVVTETCFNINHVGFVSEKIYKPIIGCRPFLVYDTDGACKWLQDRGFCTFTDDFDDICDLDLKQPDNICDFLYALGEQPASYFAKKFIDLRHKILYNKNHFQLHVQRQRQILQKGISCPI